MTNKNNLDEYQARRERQAKLNKIGMSKLTEKQLQSIKMVHKTLSQTLDMLVECKDLYLSDIRNLEDCFYKIQNNFNVDNFLEDNND